MDWACASIEWFKIRLFSSKREVLIIRKGKGRNKPYYLITLLRLTLHAIQNLQSNIPSKMYFDCDPFKQFRIHLNILAKTGIGNLQMV